MHSYCISFDDIFMMYVWREAFHFDCCHEFFPLRLSVQQNYIRERRKETQRSFLINILK